SVPPHDYPLRRPIATPTPAQAHRSSHAAWTTDAAAGGIRGGRAAGVPLHLLRAVAALARAADRAGRAGTADHGRGGRVQCTARCHSRAGAAPTGCARARRSGLPVALPPAAPPRRPPPPAGAPPPPAPGAPPAPTQTLSASS